MLAEVFYCNKYRFLRLKFSVNFLLPHKKLATRTIFLNNVLRNVKI